MYIEEGFYNRMKKLTPIRMLGTGMDLGELNEYAYEICFLLIQNIFKRELNENPNRTRDDMIFITEKILKDMNLEASREIVERIVDGTLWYRESTKQEAFSTEIFNENKVSKEEYTFRYFKIDRENSLWEQGGSTVYMLSEESQEMIFITREILEEFGFDLEQFYTLQLIKTGNLSKANNSIDGLIGRVRTLINREKEYKRTIIRNPQNIMFNRSNRGEKTEKEVREQFQEEQDLFQKMFSWKSRYDSLPEDRKAEAEEMFDKLQRARSLHDTLAKYVIENLALEIEIRVNHPESFWRLSNLSFKKDIWRENIIKNGLNKIEDLESILSILFSPKIEFIYPLNWAWAEQKNKHRRKIKDYEEEIFDEIWDFRETNWELIVELWEDIFISLLNKRSFSILELNEKDEKERFKWLSQRENIDLFMMFVISPIVLKRHNNGKDERLKVFQLLCEKNPDIEALEGEKIFSRLEDTDKRFEWKELFISPYTIYIKE